MAKGGLVYGVGVNDADYYVTKESVVDGKRVTIWRCPYYIRWCAMLGRCYSKKYHERQPTYKGCTVCEEWKYFSNFREWMEQRNWQDRDLDKDFLSEGNKIYGPDTCVFIPSKMNAFIIASSRAKGLYPIGVRYMNKSKGMINERAKPYRSVIRDQIGGRINLGCYSTPEEAHQRYLVEKLKQCMDYIEEFKDEPLTIKGLTRIYNKIQYHIDNNLELTSF